MRFFTLLALFLAAHVRAQTDTETEPGPQPTTSVVLEPETTEPVTSDTFTPTPTVSSFETYTPTETASIATTTGTSHPPISDGANCVQACLAESALEAKCQGIADVRCTCASTSYLSVAQACFNRLHCQESAQHDAIQEHNAACLTLSQTTPIRSPTPSRPPTITTQTLVVTSGAVLTFSQGGATTITSGFITIRTGRAGDLGGGAPAPTPTGSNNAAIGKRSGMGLVAGLGAIGGVLLVL